MREITIYFLRMPQKVATQFAKLIGGKKFREYRDLARVVIGKEEVAGHSDITIQFILEKRTTMYYTKYYVSGATPITQDQDTGIYLYEKTEYRKQGTRKCQIYYAVCMEPITPMQVYEVYMFCLNHYSARVRLHSTGT